MDRSGVYRSAASGPCTPLADELGNPLRSAILYKTRGRATRSTSSSSATGRR